MEERVDRQLRVIGKAAQRKLSKASVLIVGLGGLGVEIAKNVILTGFRKVGIYDNSIATYFDLGTQFFLKESDVGEKTRVRACFDELKSLNEFCDVVDESQNEFNEELIQKYSVLITTEDHISNQIELNDMCRKHGVFFISSECRGLFSAIFVDFGDGFLCSDTNGEKEASGVISGVEIREDGTCIVNTLDFDNVVRQNLSDGDVIKFFDIKGIPELNKAERKITKIDAFTFNIGKLEDTTARYESGGRYIQVKQPTPIPFEPLRSFFGPQRTKQPEFLLYDWSKFGHPPQLHLAFESLARFRKIYDRLPFSYARKDAKVLTDIARQILQENNQTGSFIDENIMHNLSFTCRGLINPMVTFIGGLVAQEAQKGVTGKFHPIKQFFYFESLSSLPENLTELFRLSSDNEEILRKEFEPLNCRYDSQIVVFGKSFQEKLSQVNMFLVGCGALGCEFVKNFAMTGLCCNGNGKLTMTDMDEIETSNLSRQFLFRDRHIGKMKSECAAEAGRDMNPSLFVLPLVDRVGPSTEETAFPDAFWEGLDGCVTALDNIPARKYVDQQCVFFRKPMFESGTLGTKCHTQVILPMKSDVYSSQEDAEQQTFPECSIHVHPNVIQHTISWAKRLFSQKFDASGREAETFLKGPQRYMAEKGSNSLMMESLHEVLIRDRPKNFGDCVGWARSLYEDLFHYGILSILRKHPHDEKTDTGAMFWTGTKRCPSPITHFDLEDPMTRAFVISTAKLRARFYGIMIPQQAENSSDFMGNLKKVCSSFKPLPSGPPGPSQLGSVPMKDEEEELEGEGGDEMKDEEDRRVAKEQAEMEKRRIEMEGWKSEIHSQLSTLQTIKFETMEFEKDDDLHLRFITSASNLRARNYKIPEIDAYETKGIAGSIVPAMITTTAIATGLMMFEVLKYVQEKRELSDFTNGFLNIGIPLILLNDPKESPVKIMGKYTPWDRVLIRKPKDVPLEDIIRYLEMNYDVKVKSIAYQHIALYLPGITDDERNLKTPVRQLIGHLKGERVSKKRKYVKLTVSVEYRGKILKEFVPVAYTINQKLRKKYRKRKKKITGKKIIKT